MYYETDTRDCKLGIANAAEKKQEVPPDVATHPKQTTEPEVIDWGEDGNPIYAEITEQPEDAAEADGEDVKDEDGDEVQQDEKSNALGVDVVFLESSALFGLPEHTTPVNLPNTKLRPPRQNLEPYRLYTLDVYEYDLDSTMALYGAIPIVFSHAISPAKTSYSCSVFWNNPSDTFVDISEEEISLDVQNSPKTFSARKVKWMSETGNFDLFLFPGNTVSKVMKQIRDTTGPAILPPLFSLGYHQCRWNYNSEDDLLGVNRGFEEHDIPVDVLWLDIEHTDGRRYFTFDKKSFPTPEKMFNEVDYFSRKVVLIVDPHIKRDKNYFVHKAAEEQGLYIRDSSGEKDFDGWCWPGSSSYIDFTSEKSRQFWAGLFSVQKYKGTVNNVVHIWNDMNEPSVFNHPEVTIPKDTRSLEGIEFKEFHNLYGFYFQASTQAGLLFRDLEVQIGRQSSLDSALVWRALKYNSPASNSELKALSTSNNVHLHRGFVLSRAFYAGSQRFGAVWTGDNMAKWEHLRASVPMILSAAMAGLPFVGADVGGFFGNPSTELLVRWYQVAAYQPFFRAHAHLESKRREPWLFGEATTQLIRSAIASRYKILPYIYTTFRDTAETGLPVMRPLFMEFPTDVGVLDCEDEWLLGDALLVAPVLHEAQKQRVVKFPECEWYDINTYENHQGGEKSFDVTLERVPVFQRGGTIIVQKERLRRSSTVMHKDPLTLVVALDTAGNAKGRLYLDDETTFDYDDRSAFCIIEFVFSEKKLTSKPTCFNESVFQPTNLVERIIIVGKIETLGVASSATVTSNGSQATLEVTSQREGCLVIIHNPAVAISNDFEVTL